MASRRLSLSLIQPRLIFPVIQTGLRCLDDCSWVCTSHALYVIDRLRSSFVKENHPNHPKTKICKEHNDWFEANKWDSQQRKKPKVGKNWVSVVLSVKTNVTKPCFKSHIHYSSAVKLLKRYWISLCLNFFFQA